MTACSPRSSDLPPLADVATDNMLGVVQEQLRQSRDAVLKSPDRDDLVGQYGLALATYGFDEAADIAFTRARILAPDVLDWMQYHAFVQQRIGATDAAMKTLELGLADHPEHIGLLAMHAELLFNAARFDEAAVVLSTVITRDPDHVLAQFYQGRIYNQNQQWDLAVEAFRKLQSQGVQTTEVHFHLATALRATGNPEEAAQQLKLADNKRQSKISGHDPTIEKLSEFNLSDEPHVIRAGALYNAGKVQQAIDELLQAVNKNPDNAGAHTHLVRMYGHQLDLDKAYMHYEHALKINNALPQLHGNLAFAYENSNQYNQAARYYRLEIAQDPDNWINYARLAGVLIKFGDIDGAITQFDQSLERQPVNRDLRFAYGSELLKANKTQQAIDILSTALEPADKKGVIALRALGMAYLQAGNNDAALEQLAKALALAQSLGNDAMVRALQMEIAKMENTQDAGG